MCRCIGETEISLQTNNIILSDIPLPVVVNLRLFTRPSSFALKLFMFNVILLNYFIYIYIYILNQEIQSSNQLLIVPCEILSYFCKES